MKAVTTNESYPLSPLQQGMLYHYLSDSKSGQYIQQAVCELKEKLNIDLFKNSWEIIIKRYPVLRTAFKWHGENEPIQIVQKNVDLPFYQEDLRDLRKEEQDKRVDEYLRLDQINGFDLRKAPLSRFTLFHLDQDYYKLIWSNHHIILDGRSRALVLKEVFRIYEDLCRQTEIKIEETQPFKDYIKWIGNHDFSMAKKFWEKALAGFDSPVSLEFDQKAVNFNEAAVYGESEYRLSENETSILRDWASCNSANINTVMQLAWAVLLSYYSKEKDVVFGTVRSCRRLPLEGIGSMVGLFINTLPVRVQIKENMKTADLLRSIKEQNVAQRPYDHTPLIMVQECSRIRTGSTLFESYIVFDFKQMDSVLRDQGGPWENRNFKIHERTNYPLGLTVFGEKELLIKISFNLKRFSPVFIERMAGHLLKLLKGIAKEPDLCISDYTILTEDEEKQILIDWNNTSQEYPKETVLHELFEAQVDRTPDAVALEFKDAQLTYRELDNRANQLGRHLRLLGIGAESLVGVFMERSLEMVVGLYGILKAGGAYVPLDPEYPQDRLAFMIEDTQIPVILTQKHLLTSLPDNDSAILSLDADWDIISENPADRLEIINTEDNLAYVIFTSGSTGKPKGVMNEHRGICNRLFWMQEAYQLDAKDHILQKTPFSFDVSVWEFFWPLLYGARLVIAPAGAHRDTTELVNLIIGQRITTLHFVPSMMQLFLEDPAVEQCRSLKRVICSGEALPYDLQRRFFERIDAELHNLYGPTEAAVDVTYWQCQRESELDMVPIGRPIANTQIYILDGQMQPVPIGIAGELHIGGIQVARGYINRPELTAEKFIADPFSDKPGARLYKTGDLARFLEDGSIEYLGRMDFQVKIRGLRVELGEIESRMDEFGGISQSVVVLREDSPGDQHLVAYYVNQGGHEVDVTPLRNYLHSCLPDYMVPQHYMQLDAMPLSPNGKTDRKALPRPKFERKTDVVYLAPRIKEEKVVVDIWKELLQIDKVGIDDSFFDLGGHSLLLVRMLGKLKPHFEKELRVVDFFRYPTINKLVAYLMKEVDEIPEFTSAATIASRQKEFMRRQKKIASRKMKYHA